MINLQGLDAGMRMDWVALEYMAACLPTLSCGLSGYSSNPMICAGVSAKALATSLKKSTSIALTRPSTLITSASA